MAVVRWTFTDPYTDETWVHTINPDQATSPFPVTTGTYGAGVRTGLTAARTILPPLKAVEWTFGGAIRSQAHHDELVSWARRGPVHLTDHLGRTFVVVLTGLDVTERKPTKTLNTRWRYTMRALLLRQLETP